MNDLKDWNDSLDKQVQIKKWQSEKYAKACHNCGDKGYELERASTGLGYDSLNLVYCECNTGQNLLARFTRKDLNGKE